LNDYAKLIKLETFNRVHFANSKKITLYADDQKMKQEIAAVFPGDEKGLDKFNEIEDKKMRACYGLLERPIRNAFDCISVDWLASLPSIPFGKSLVDVFANYFTDEQCRLAFSFHSKYLG
jgi:phytoene desaturase